MSVAASPIRDQYSPGVATRLLDEGVYDPREVVHLLGLRRVDRVTRWTRADHRGKPAVVDARSGELFRFVDLVTIALVEQLVERGVSSAHIRQGLASLREATGHDRPLAHRDVVARMATSGRSLVEKRGGGWVDLGRGGQSAFESITSLDARGLQYDVSGQAEAWQPREHIRLDPRVQAGAPCIAGTRLTTATIATLAHGDELEDIAAEYEVPLEAVRAAVAFEHDLDEGIGIAA